MNNDELKKFEEQLKGQVTPKNDLKAFEDRLKQQFAPKPVTDLRAFEQKLKNKNTAPVNGQKVKITKNVILSFQSDFSGCGFLRNMFPMSFLNSAFGKSGKLMTICSPVFLYQEDILARSRSIFFQRQMTKSHYEIISKYKEIQQRLKYKLVWDMDDFIWGHNELQGGTKEDGVPSYNFGWPNISDEIKTYSVEIMNLMDTLTFSTQYLADYAKNELKVKPPCVVVPNAIQKFLWGTDKREPITNRIEKPKVLYTGSPTHYSNKDRLLGDFDNAWKDWVIKSVNENKIEFVCMGGLPWFFEEIKDKIELINWVDSYSYPRHVKAVKADFGISPLVPNQFNHSKSDVKYIEYCNCGIIGIGTTFTNGKPSPYDNNILSLPDTCTVEDIDAVFDQYCEPELYNDVMKKQYDYLEVNSRFLESGSYINLLTSVF